jgi:Rod binding domain-containing protein
MSSAGLPPIDPAFEPASVRSGSPAVQKAYASALDFESMLVQQLSQSLGETSGLGGEGESPGEGGSEGGGGDPVSMQLSSLLPQTLTNSVMSHGGLGMAQQLMGSLLPAGQAAKQGVAAGAGAAGASAVTVGGGSLANAPTGSAGATAQIDPTGGIQA